jgi:hypothetical protein
MLLMVSCLAEHIVGGIRAGRIGRDRSKIPKSGKCHKSSFLNVRSFCVAQVAVNLVWAGFSLNLDTHKNLVSFHVNQMDQFRVLVRGLVRSVNR